MIPSRGELLVDITIFIEVKPHKRPRLGARVYQDKQYALIDKLLPFAARHPIIKPVILDCYYYFTDKAKRDVDNLDKNLYDRIVDARIINDDNQIYGGEHFKIYGAKENMLEVKIWEVKRVTDI